MDPVNRGRSLSAGRVHHLSRPSSASPHPHVALSYTGADSSLTLNNHFNEALNNRLSFQDNSSAYDPSITADLNSQAQFSLDATSSDFRQQQSHSQANGLGSAAFTPSQNFQNANTTTESNAFPSFDLTQPLFDDASGLDLSDFNSDGLDLLPQSTSGGGLDGSLANDTLTPMAAAMSPPHTQTPPHLLQPDITRHHSSSPSPNASPSFGQTSFPMNRPRNVSDSLDPASAMYPQIQNNEWANMSMAPYQHRRMPSDNASDISSAHASPYIGTMDGLDSSHAHSSPLLHPRNDPAFSDNLGLHHFSLNENNLSQQSFHTPSHTPGHSPHLMPQQALPPFTAENNFGLLPSMNGQYSSQQNGIDMYGSAGAEPFPTISAQSPGGLSDAASPPAINISYAPSQQNPIPALKAETSDDQLMPPARSNRARAKSDSHAGSRPASPFMRGRSPSLQPHIGNPSDNLGPFDSRASSRASSPAVRGRNNSASGRARSTSNSDQRDYILDLANPERSPSTGGDSRRVQKHPATYQCTLCPKRFTRAYNLRSHLRTHTDERPFVCTVCGKAFARQHDRKRHEGLHSGEKKFVCRGALQAGTQWGCGRRFARADALGRHFRSEAGRVCIKPLLDEEAAERQRLAMEQQHQAQMVAGLATAPIPSSLDVMNNFLPQAILQQYPALANIDWSQIAQGSSGQDDDYSGAGGRSSYDGTSGGESFYDDASEGEMGNFNESVMNGMNGMSRVNELSGGMNGMSSVHANHQHTHLPVQQPGYMYQSGNQPGDYISDLEGR